MPPHAPRSRTRRREPSRQAGLVKNDVFSERRTRLELVLGVLEDRLAARPFAFRKPVPGIPDDRLYEQAPPTRDEAQQLLMLALDTESAVIIDELFQALHAQGRNRDLVSWWSLQATENGPRA